MNEKLIETVPLMTTEEYNLYMANDGLCPVCGKIFKECEHKIVDLKKFRKEYIKIDKKVLEDIKSIALDYLWVDWWHHKQYALEEIMKLIEPTRENTDYEKWIPD